MRRKEFPHPAPLIAFVVVDTADPKIKLGLLCYTESGAQEAAARLRETMDKDFRVLPVTIEAGSFF